MRTGAATINANGANSTGTPFTTLTSGSRVGGGGGAGGSIVLYGTGATITANTAGGNGFLNTSIINNHVAHGGGGGGGAVFANGALAGVTTSVLPGLAGCSQAGAVLDTLAAVCGVADLDSSTNGTAGTATAFVSAAEPGLAGCAANLGIAKTDAVVTVTAGQITTYTLTVTNTGPGAADGALLKDPVVPGLVCTAVSCTGSVPAGNCPAPAGVTIANLQGTGIVLNPLPLNTTLTFQVVCGVTATGL